MKRKVIQIADSTLLVSLPKKWACTQNIKKGDEIDVLPDGNKLTITNNSEPAFETAEINLSEFGNMAPRVIFDMYKGGIDEVKINLDKPSDFKLIQESLQSKTVGFEVVEQRQNYCIIRNVLGQPEEFESLLRRLFLLLVTMSDEGLSSIKNKDIENIRNLKHMEESNNRLTQICRRYINKSGKVSYAKIGPLYYIVEELEKVADEYKYLFNYLSDDKSRLELSSDFFGIYERINAVVKDFHHVFYKFDAKKLAHIGEEREKIKRECNQHMEKPKSKSEAVAFHYLSNIVERVFNMIGPHIAISIKKSDNKI